MPDAQLMNALKAVKRAEGDKGATVEEISLEIFGNAKAHSRILARERIREAIAEGILVPGRAIRLNLAGSQQSKPVYRLKKKGR